MLEPQPNLRIKLNVGMIAGAIAIVLFGMAILSRKTDPHFSSFAFISALLMLFGMAANFAVPKIQSFMHDQGYKPNLLYTDYPSAIEYGDSDAGIDNTISCIFGDGGCDGGS